jgi:glucose-6-phosphate 1-epimerase
MDIATLNEHFGVPGALTFEDHAGLTRAQIKTPACEATVYLHGAHITHWQPTGQKPVLFLSGQSNFAPDKAIRGGIPVCFPWFGPRTPEITGATTEGPMHGFARIQSWEIAFAALAGDTLHLTLTLAPSEQSRALGFDHFQAVLEFAIGSTLSLKLTVANTGSAPLVFEEALHTYFAVEDCANATLYGLEGVGFIDKTDGMKVKTMPEGPFQFTDETDRLLNGTATTCLLEDHGNARAITIAKSGSNSTVIWNPWAERSKQMADLGDEDWHRFLCVETVNANTDRITLPPTQTHTMQARISVTED